MFPSCWVLIICPICHHIKGFILEQDINRLTGKLVLFCSFLYTHQHLQIRQIGGQQVLPRLPRQKRFYLRVFVCVFGLETTGCEVTGCTLMKGPEHWKDVDDSQPHRTLPDHKTRPWRVFCWWTWTRGQTLNLQSGCVPAWHPLTLSLCHPPHSRRVC